MWRLREHWFGRSGVSNQKPCPWEHHHPGVSALLCLHAGAPHEGLLGDPLAVSRGLPPEIYLWISKNRWHLDFQIILPESPVGCWCVVIGHLGELSWVEPPGTPVQFASIATDNSSGNCAARASVLTTWQHYLGSFGPLGLLSPAIWLFIFLPWNWWLKVHKGASLFRRIRFCCWQPSLESFWNWTPGSDKPEDNILIIVSNLDLFSPTYLNIHSLLELGDLIFYNLKMYCLSFWNFDFGHLSVKGGCVSPWFAGVEPQIRSTCPWWTPQPWWPSTPPISTLVSPTGISLVIFWSSRRLPPEKPI